MSFGIILMKVPEDIHKTSAVEYLIGADGKDREFGHWMTGIRREDRVCSDSYCCTDIYSRPACLDEARDWIKENMPWEEEEPRLLEVLDHMEKDLSLYFYFSV